jgi:hypothetical protein
MYFLKLSVRSYVVEIAQAGFSHQDVRRHPWRLSADGPGASRTISMGRHPKPITKGDISA